jgi:hypothetical protein
MHYILPAISISLYIAGISVIIRNNQVSKFRTRLVKMVGEKAEVDIKLGLPWEWRYETLDLVAYDTMVKKFWVPMKPERWWKDTTFLQTRIPVRVIKTSPKGGIPSPFYQVKKLDI